jgi:hypothetical protein
MSTPTAIVLTWDSTTVRVRCPYSCSRGIHSHGFTRPGPGKRNTRVPHCTPRKDDNGHYAFSRDYRLLFPFEEDPETEGMWWELDYHKKRWRTVSWRTYDPEYWETCNDTKPPLRFEERNDLESRVFEEDETDVMNAFSGLTFEDANAQIKHDTRYELASQKAVEHVADPEKPLPGLTVGSRRKRKLLFDSVCISNLLGDARKLLVDTTDAKKLVNEKGPLDGKPLLLAVVEEGHEDVVKFLLDTGAELEAKDRDGNTALLRALHFGRGIVAEQLIAGGADMNAANYNGETVCDIARASLELQKESAGIERMTIHPRQPPLVKIHSNIDRIQENLDARKKEIGALQRTIKSCERRQMIEQLVVRLQKIGQMYGEEQAEAVKQRGELDDQALLVRLLTQVMDTPRGTEWKTVACLARGTVFPWIFAVSGYTTSIPDGALHRPTWNKRVFDLAKVVGHDLKADYRDGTEKTGSYFACHSEKQLLAYFIWSHTTYLCPDDQASLQRSESQQNPKLHAEIYIGQPGQNKAEVCDDCCAFCQKTVSHFGFQLTLKGVVQGEVAWNHPVYGIN